MVSPLRTLAVIVNNLVATHNVTVVETPAALTISGLAADVAKSLLPTLKEVGSAYELVDRAGEAAELDAITEDYAPFIATISKQPKSGCLQVITHSGLKDFLAQELKEPIWEVVSLDTPFATMATSYVPLGNSTIFSPAPDTKSPRQIVRDYNSPLVAPTDIRIWTLRLPATDDQWRDATFQVFAECSVYALMSSLAFEVKPGGGLFFKGPPSALLSRPSNETATELTVSGYNDLREAVVWVYESKTDAEQRHGLFNAEFGRSNVRSSDPALVFKEVCRTSLEGARLSYQLFLSDLTRESIKAQADLRKAVVDDTAKMADNTRQIVAAVATTLLTCIGLVAARIGTQAPHWALQIIAFVAGAYVASVVFCGWTFMNLQREMRTNWRKRLYRFIPDEDYEVMVTSPAEKAELMFRIAAIAGGVVSTLSIVITSLIFYIP